MLLFTCFSNLCLLSTVTLRYLAAGVGEILAPPTQISLINSQSCYRDESRITLVLSGLHSEAIWRTPSHHDIICTKLKLKFKFPETYSCVSSTTINYSKFTTGITDGPPQAAGLSNRLLAKPIQRWLYACETWIYRLLPQSTGKTISISDLTYSLSEGKFE